MEHKYVWIEVDVKDELPTERDLYICLVKGRYNGEKWYRYDYLDFCANSFSPLKEHEVVTHWLRRVLIPQFTLASG